MRVTPPSFKARNEPSSALDYELAQERAAALGRSGRNLESALTALRTFDYERAIGTRDTGSDKGDRDALVSIAGVALWHFIVQREALGLRDSAHIMRAYAVPADVQARMGAFPADPAKRRK